MSSFQLDSEGDLDITSNSLSLTTGTEAIRQHLQVKLRMFLGEWFLNTDLGVPYFTEILIKQPNFINIQNRLKLEITETPGVIEIIQFSFDFDSEIRLFTLTFKVSSEEGVIDFTQEIDA